MLRGQPLERPQCIHFGFRLRRSRCPTPSPDAPEACHLALSHVHLHPRASWHRLASDNYAKRRPTELALNRRRLTSQDLRAQPRKSPTSRTNFSATAYMDRPTNPSSFAASARMCASASISASRPPPFRMPGSQPRRARSLSARLVARSPARAGIGELITAPAREDAAAVEDCHSPPAADPPGK